MAQSSGPIAQGTTTERQFTDVQWRDRFGDEPGVLADMDGSSYAITLPSGSDIATLGSTTQSSLATVAGFFHRIPVSSPESIEIPPASGSTRTDIIALRYDPAYTGLPGPVRLVRIAGSTSAIPSYDSTPPGVEELPLWAVTRAVGQNLSQASLVRMFPRIAPSLELAVGAPLPASSPLGTVVKQGLARFRRRLNASLVPEWAVDKDIPVLASIAARNTYFAGNLQQGDAALVAGAVHVYDGVGWRFTATGTGGGTTNASGQIIVTHGLGATPLRVFIQATSSAIAGIANYVPSNETSTQFTVTLYNSTNGAAIAGNPASFNWTAVV